MREGSEFPTQLRASEDEGQWLTYAEAGKLLGISAAAARMHAKRHGWRRRTPNAYGDRARVLVPAEAAVQPRSALYAERTAHVITHDQEGPNGRDQVNVRVIEQAIETLREQLARAEQRANADRSRAEHAERLLEAERGRVDEERKRVEELRTALADAVAAERIAAGVAAGLRTELDRLQPRAPWWRRWFR